MEENKIIGVRHPCRIFTPTGKLLKVIPPEKQLQKVEETIINFFSQKFSARCSAKYPYKEYTEPNQDIFSI